LLLAGSWALSLVGVIDDDDDALLSSSSKLLFFFLLLLRLFNYYTVEKISNSNGVFNEEIRIMISE